MIIVLVAITHIAVGAERIRVFHLMLGSRWRTRNPIGQEAFVAWVEPLENRVLMSSTTLVTHVDGEAEAAADASVAIVVTAQSTDNSPESGQRVVASESDGGAATESSSKPEWKYVPIRRYSA